MPLTINPVSDSLFFSKSDPKDPRLGDLAKATDIANLPKQGWLIAGYPDDEGIKLNGGRMGASSAPDQIRKYLYRMTVPETSSTTKATAIHDLGNLQSTDAELGDKHNFAQSNARKVFAAGLKLITLGGSHDYGFPDAAAFVEHNINKRPLVMNFDAHLDVRPTDKGLNSGTPFYRLLEKFHQQIDFMEIGIQPQCNSSHHQRWAQDHRALILDLASIERLGLLPAIQSLSTATKNPQTPLWLSIDIDAFRNSEAPGCSQSFATGLVLQEFLPTLRFLSANYDLQGIGIYEVSPPLDIDDRTSKLAALILFHTLFPHLG